MHSENQESTADHAPAARKTTSATPLDRFTSVLISALFWGLLAVTVTLPFTLKRFFMWLVTNQNQPEERLAYYPVKLILLMGAGVFSLLILWELHKMMGTVLRGDSFVEANVLSLRKMGIYAFLVAALMAGWCALFFTMTSLVVVLVFFIAGLFSLVLARVFGQAVAYKQENDLTI